MSPKAAAAEPTEIAGRYQVIKKLGAGAFGTVYKAKDKILGRMVAIKTIRLEGLAAAGSSLDELMDRFKREAMVSAQLKHPHIVTIYDIGESEGTSYIAMEFIDGVGLDRMIASGGKLTIERAAQMGSQVVDALDFAHKSNVVHRDIKPANIMVEDGDRVKVTDFGIAKVTDSGDHLTVTGSLLGTPSYMSPEQARGATLDGRSDLFAAGCVLYEMVAGRKAFRGDSITGLIFKIITEEPPSLKEMDPDVPEEMLRIVAKALAKTPDARYQTGREMADDLLRLTRAGASPTLRQTELSTAPGMAPVSPLPGAPGGAGAPAPALATMVMPGTVNSPGTVQGAAATRVAPPPTPRPPSPPAVAPGPPVRGAGRPAPGPSPARSGGSMGLILGLVGGGLVLLLALGVGAWVVLRPKDTKVTDSGGGVSGTGSTRTATPPPVTAPPVTAPPDTAPPVTAPPPATAPPATTGGGVAPPATLAPVTQPPATRPPRTAPPATEPASPNFVFLDQEPPPMDGREAGERLAGGYRNNGGTNSGGNFGSSGRFRPRDRSPRDLAVPERPAVATLRHIMDREEALHRKEQKYGTFADLTRATAFALDVPVSGSTFQRKGYRFELKVDGNGFEVTALAASPGLRSFMGDDSGIIRPMGE